MENFAVILSGGVGTRMQMTGCPKQYIEVNGKPILVYTLQVFQESADIQHIVVVAAKQWQESIRQWADQYQLTKLLAFAEPGSSRQESILSGLNACMEHSRDEQDRVIIHDAVRPCVSGQLIHACMEALRDKDGCMPVLPLTDTIYESTDGSTITDLPDRNKIYAGQAPEAFRLHMYTQINREASSDELRRCLGTSVIAHEHGMRVALIQGEKSNFKITTVEDLEQFKSKVGNAR